MKVDIQLTEDGAYRPDKLIINNELASMSEYLKKHGYNWKSTASGNVLFYRTKTGNEYEIPQSAISNKKEE